MKKVVIVQRILPHYRVHFFEQLSHSLKAENIELNVLYGIHRQGCVPKSVTINQPWAIKIKNNYFFSKNNELVWQSCFLKALKADLVIIEQANRLLLNYPLLFLRNFIKPKIAFWGHGRNFQSNNPTSTSETWKKWLSKQVDWWFAYTKDSATLVENIGFPRNKITITQNTIYTESLIQEKNKITLSQSVSLKKSMNIDSENVAIFCGGMYEYKKISFLIDACKKIKKRVPDFHMIFIGDGPNADLVSTFSNQHSWVHFVGEKQGVDTVPYFVISKLMLMPGLVGLSAIDSFALGVPIVSTEIPIHSPEFSYLKHGINSNITAYNIDDYEVNVSKLLKGNKSLNILVRGCSEAKEKYKMEHMVTSFTNAIEQLFH